MPLPETARSPVASAARSSRARTATGSAGSPTSGLPLFPIPDVTSSVEEALRLVRELAAAVEPERTPR